MPSPRPHATDAELAILKLLWEGGPLAAREIREQLYPGGTPSDHATVQTLLGRLERKRLIRRDRSEFAHSFTATVSREELAGDELEALAAKLTDGSLVPFILHAVSSKQLSAKERNEIRELLEGRKPGRTKS
jgi:predicted transcriptional regulator